MKAEEEIKEAYKNAYKAIIRPDTSNAKLSVSDLVLVVLYNGSVAGKIKMQNEMFLAYEIMKKNVEYDPIFRYSTEIGYYSQFILNAINYLAIKNKIIKIGKGQGHQSYVITAEGVDYINLLMKDNLIPKNRFQKLKTAKQSWDEWDTIGILNYIRRNYGNEW